MASNRPAPAAPFVPGQESPEPFAYGSIRTDEGPWEEWNPTEESIRPVRGRHRVAKQRGGLARSSTVLGVGVIAAVGAGGMASAAPGKAPVSISLPDLPNVGSLISDDEPAEPEATPLSDIGGSALAATAGEASGTATAATAADAGEALRTRIMAQAEQQQVQVDTKAQAATEAALAKEAQQAAAAAEKKAAEEAAAAKKEAEEEAAKKAEEERLAELARQYSLPTSSYTLTSTFGQAGSMWSSGHHTGLDFAAPHRHAPQGRPHRHHHRGGLGGSYGYRTILTLDDGTEIWYCHQSSISVSVGQKVNTGDVIGRVGATGNVTGPHLHLEVHPGGDATGIDPAAWLRSKGLNP
ncbi:M23 family metallopeptidase [Streptomyces thermocoprophilus]